MAIVGGSAKGGVEVDINQVDQNMSFQRSSLYVF